MLLANPATYLSVADFKAQPNDYALTAYTDSQLQDMLVRASGKADAIMRKSLLAQEQTIRYRGDGTNILNLSQRPLLYVKRVQIITPGTVAFSLPTDQLLVDYDAGEFEEYTPLLWQGVGYGAIFPYNVPIDVTLAWGYTPTSIVKVPVYTLSDDANAGGIPGALYNVAITARTFWGETASIPQVFECTKGQITATISPGLGVYVYRAYISPAANNTTVPDEVEAGAGSLTPASGNGFAVGSQWLFDPTGDAEVVTVAAFSDGVATLQSPTQYEHDAGAVIIPVPTCVSESPFTAYGTSPLTIAISQLTPGPGLFADTLPTVDTTAAPIPAAITEAVRLLTLSMIFEQNNLANRGIYQQRSNRKQIAWKSTEGMSGRGTPLLEEQAANLLAPYGLEAIY